ncbi:PilN domain-containing protein [Sphingomonas sp. KR3-1]|uniref:PilN domain-containing protein n=1 Tax=Sphingomonas sp. KR3-1 TaxID=3156611 RepID=UPI0032B5CE11
MNPRALLDADMRMIGQWLLQGWQWWSDEIRALIPARLQRSSMRELPRFIVCDGALAPARPGQRVAVPGPGARVTLVVPAADCLVRTITRPALGDRDLHRMLAFEADALLPIPVASVVLAARIEGAADAPGLVRVRIAGLPIAAAHAIAEAAEAADVVPVAVVVEQPQPQPAPLDFAPAMRAAGLLARQRSATPLLWVLVAVLLLLNLAMAIWRDAAHVAQFERIVAEQQPAVGIAQAISRRGEQDRRLVARSLALRRARDPLDVLAAVSASLPTGTWLQRLAWDGEAVRLTGYRPERADVATALRRSGRFVGVRSMGESAEAAMPTGQPFDLSAKVEPR